MIVQVSGFAGCRREKIGGRLRIWTEGALEGLGTGRTDCGHRGHQVHRERRREMRILLALLCVASIAIVPVRSKAKPGDSASSLHGSAQQNGVVEQGKFVRHKFEQAIGEETYQITREGESVAVKVEFKFTDRRTPVPLNVTLRAAQDLTPSAFEIKGKTSRQSTIDKTVEIQGEKVRVRDREKWTEVARPQSYFTIAGYAPATMQMLMVRYWASHGSPVELATLPGGKVKIEPRGEYSISIRGKEERLKHYVIEGLVWGREALWFDAKNNLVAAVTFDAEFDHFEAVREGYESALGTFVGRAGADGMASLAEYAKGISRSRAEKLALVGGTLIDGKGGASIADATVVIEKGRITAAGPRAQVKVPSGAKEIDAHGKFILPGLWDMHAHFEQVEWGPVYLAAGATTVRDVGNEFEFITAVRDAVAAGRGLGPRLLLAGVVDGSSISRRRVPADEDLQLGEAGRIEGGDGGSAQAGDDRDRTCARRDRHVSGNRSGAGSDQSPAIRRGHDAGAVAEKCKPRGSTEGQCGYRCQFGEGEECNSFSAGASHGARSNDSDL
jgi:hypothetical protein